MLQLVPCWDYLDNNTPYLDGFWLRCPLHGDIKYYELIDPIETNDLEEEIDEHLHSLHFS
jgi:hypothetical protein